MSTTVGPRPPPLRWGDRPGGRGPDGIPATYGRGSRRLPLITFLSLFLGVSAMGLALLVALMPEPVEAVAPYVWASYGLLFFAAFELARRGAAGWATGVLLTTSLIAPWTLLFLHPLQPFGIYFLLSVVIAAVLLRPVALLVVLAINAAAFGVYLWQAPGGDDSDILRVTAMVLIGLMLWGATFLGTRDHVVLERALANVRAVVENTPDPIVSLDLDWEVIALNRAAEARGHQVFGMDTPLAVGSRIVPDRIGVGRDDLWHLERGEPLHVQQHRDEGGGEAFYDININPIRGRGRDPLGYAVQARDITERVRQDEREKAAFAQAMEVQKLKEVSAYKSNLLNAASHELATPMTPLLVQVHLLRESFPGGPSPDQAHYLEVLERNIRRLHAIINDILEVVRIESRHIQLKRTPIHVEEVVREEVGSFRATADQKGVRLRVAPLPDLVVAADRRRFAQVLGNLLSNAIKFTPASGTVEVSCEERPGWARIAVEDTGIGIPQERLHELFEPFQQLHEQEDYVQGAGLGLYISQGIVLAHGGTMGVHSEGAGRGSTFWFELPLISGRATTATSTSLDGARTRHPQERGTVRRPSTGGQAGPVAATRKASSDARMRR